jgi:hypothetical protein
MTLKKALLLLVLSASIVAVGRVAYQAWRYPCVSREPGLRGEMMRAADGGLLYFNGQCWTGKPMPPRDTPF